jgi:hypothetical protein
MPLVKTKVEGHELEPGDWVSINGDGRFKVVKAKKDYLWVRLRA